MPSTDFPLSLDIIAKFHDRAHLGVTAFAHRDLGLTIPLTLQDNRLSLEVTSCDGWMKRMIEEKDFESWRLGDEGGRLGMRKVEENHGKVGKRVRVDDVDDLLVEEKKLGKKRMMKKKSFIKLDTESEVVDQPIKSMIVATKTSRKVVNKSIPKKEETKSVHGVTSSSTDTFLGLGCIIRDYLTPNTPNKTARAASSSKLLLVEEEEEDVIGIKQSMESGLDIIESRSSRDMSSDLSDAPDE
jgi:hypothetical protein